MNDHDHNSAGETPRVWKVSPEDFARMKADLERPAEIVPELLDLARRTYWRMSPERRDEFDRSARTVGLTTDEAITHVARVKRLRGEVSS